MQIFGILSHFPISAYNASLPLLSRAAVRGDGRENLFIEVVLRFIIFSGTFLALTCMAFGEDAILYVFGSKYTDAGKIIGLIIWMMIPWSTMNALMKVQMARQKSRTSMIFYFYRSCFFCYHYVLDNSKSRNLRTSHCNDVWNDYYMWTTYHINLSRKEIQLYPSVDQALNDNRRQL